MLLVLVLLPSIGKKEPSIKFNNALYAFVCVCLCDSFLVVAVPELVVSSWFNKRIDGDNLP